MMFTALAVAATVVGGPFYSFRDIQPHAYSVGGRMLATPLAYPAGRVDSVHRPGFNGLIWLGERFIGGEPDQVVLDWGSPGPTAYGASQFDAQRVYVHVGHVRFSISPWSHIGGDSLGYLENARNQWLKENGYVGGVRTFVNDLYLDGEHGGRHASREIKPRAVIELPDDMPRFRSRERVQAPAKAPCDLSGARIVLPDSASRALVAASQRVAATRVADSR